MTLIDEHSTASLPRSAPEAQGIASAAILDFVRAADESIKELHSFMLLRHGHVIAEAWWKPYVAERPHVMYSLSKSFASTAAGFAVAEGLLSLDDKVVSFFPDDLPDDVGDDNLAAMRVRDLLTMTTGHAEDTLRRLYERNEDNWARAFLRQPVSHEPGTHFVYNSGATYMVSAIVQKRAGQPILEYLGPRLFTPLGITDATWETCPRGINTGGWGLSIKTEDIARFGQLYLQKGVWEGKRVLPDGWAEEATAYHVPNGGDRPSDSDWAQGYGYQFWRCRYGAYRGDGAFGQFCVVMPEQDAVFVTTAGVGDMQSVLNLVWDRLLPAFEQEPLPEDEAGSAALRAKRAALTLRTPEGRAASPVGERVSGRTYRFAENEQNIEAITLHFDGGGACVVDLRDKYGAHRIECGLPGVWREGTTTFEDTRSARPVAASGAWTGDDTFTVKFCLVETPYCPTLTFRFEGDDILHFTYRSNVAFGPAERPTLTGQAETA